MNVNEFVDVRNRIIRMINSNDFIRDYSNSPQVRRAIDIMLKTLDVIAKGRRTGVGDNMMNDVVKGTMIVMEKAIYSRQTRFMVDFALTYVDLLLLWNKELGYNYDLDIMGDAISAIVRSYLTITEANDILRNLIDRVEKYLKVEPPAYGVSRHYLKLVYERLDNDKPVGDYPNPNTCPVPKNTKQSGDAHRVGGD